MFHACSLTNGDQISIAGQRRQLVGDEKIRYAIIAHNYSFWYLAALTCFITTVGIYAPQLKSKMIARRLMRKRSLMLTSVSTDDYSTIN